MDHVEYRDRLRLYEEIHCSDRVAQMHGAAVASIAVGKTVGVAPEAELYFISRNTRDMEARGAVRVGFSLGCRVDRSSAGSQPLPAMGSKDSCDFDIGRMVTAT